MSPDEASAQGVQIGKQSVDATKQSRTGEKLCSRIEKRTLRIYNKKEQRNTIQNTDDMLITCAMKLTTCLNNRVLQWNVYTREPVYIGDAYFNKLVFTRLCDDVTLRAHTGGRYTFWCQSGIFGACYDQSICPQVKKRSRTIPHGEIVVCGIANKKSVQFATNVVHQTTLSCGASSICQTGRCVQKRLGEYRVTLKQNGHAH